MKQTQTVTTSTSHPVAAQSPAPSSTDFSSRSQCKNPANKLNTLGEKIFLDRYALKDGTKETLKIGDLVIVCVDLKSGQREVGVIRGMSGQKVEVELRDGERVLRSIEHVDKPLETSPEETMDRVARGIAKIEANPEQWESEFRWLLDGWKFIPAGRILAAAGCDQQLSLYNCYVLPLPHDSRHGIIKTLSEQMEIMSRGGGVGITLSSLRPRHAYVKGVNGRSSGSVSWGALYSFVTGQIEQGGSRRGALMLILDVWHPDILEFVNAKREAGQITNANISVGISDEFMEAVKADQMWELVFPDTTHPDFDKEWDGELDTWVKAGRPVNVHKTVRAREIWDQLVESAWASAEPGLWFKGRSNKMSNSHYFAPLVGCNPCGEQALPGYGVCNLGSLNLPRFLVEQADGSSEVDWDSLKRAVRLSTRFLDNVIDANPYFIAENRLQQQAERRVGLGTMGIGEMMIRLKIRYGSQESLDFIDKLYECISTEAYLTSADIAEEKGAFPQFDAKQFLSSGFMKKMPGYVREAVAEKGIRNVTLLTQPPTGTTGTMVNTSTGIEPFFYWEYDRRSRLGVHTERVAVYQEWLEQNGPDAELPDYFTTAMDLSPEDHVTVLAAIQRWVDSAISKTSNLPSDYTVEQTRQLYEKMYDLGCKGGTIYRDRSRDTQVLNLKEETETETAAEATPVVQDTSKTSRVQKVRPRPYRRYGATFSKDTPSGTAHITMNDDDDNSPFEVFVDLGKAGSDVKAMAEALGRLMSLVLRIQSPLSPMERIQEIVSQMKGIGGANSLGFGPKRVLSLPDAVGIVLEEHYLAEDADAKLHPAHSSALLQAVPADQPAEKAATHENYVNGSHTNGTDAKTNGVDSNMVDLNTNKLNLDLGSFADICPSCGQTGFIRAGGCASCVYCGHSSC